MRDATCTPGPNMWRLTYLPHPSSSRRLMIEHMAKDWHRDRRTEWASTCRDWHRREGSTMPCSSTGMEGIQPSRSRWKRSTNMGGGRQNEERTQPVIKGEAGACCRSCADCEGWLSQRERKRTTGAGAAAAMIDIGIRFAISRGRRRGRVPATRRWTGADRRERRRRVCQYVSVRVRNINCLGIGKYYFRPGKVQAINI